jgi:hypothetical protein
VAAAAGHLPPPSDDGGGVDPVLIGSSPTLSYGIFFAFGNASFRRPHQADEKYRTFVGTDEKYRSFVGKLPTEDNPKPMEKAFFRWLWVIFRRLLADGSFSDSCSAWKHLLVKQVPSRQYVDISVPSCHFVDECEDMIHGEICQ